MELGKIVVLIILSGLVASVAHSDTATLPYPNFEAGTPATANEVDANFLELETEVNKNSDRIDINIIDIGNNTTDIGNNTTDIGDNAGLIAGNTSALHNEFHTINSHSDAIVFANLTAINLATILNGNNADGFHTHTYASGLTDSINKTNFISALTQIDQAIKSADDDTSTLVTTALDGKLGEISGECAEWDDFGGLSSSGAACGAGGGGSGATESDGTVTKVSDALDDFAVGWSGSGAGQANYAMYFDEDVSTLFVDKLSVRASTSPVATFHDLDANTGNDTNGQIGVQCTDVTGSSEDCDMVFSADSGSTLAEAFRIDTDTAGVQTIRYTASPLLNVDGVDADSSTTSTESGLELILSQVTMLRGCGDGQMLKWTESTDTWGCGNDDGGTGNLTLNLFGSVPFDAPNLTTGTCMVTDVTDTATGAASTDTIIWTPNADISGITGYTQAVSGGLTIYAWPTANEVNFKACNPTSGSIDAGSITINWRIVQ